MQVLSRLFRRLVLQKLVAAHKADQLKFFGDHTPLAERKAFAAYLAPLPNIEWYLYSKPPFGGPEAVLAYLSRLGIPFLAAPETRSTELRAWHAV